MVQLQVFETVLEFAADQHGFFDVFIFAGNTELKFQLDRFLITGRSRQVGADLCLKSLYFGDRSSHSDLKGFYGTLETL
jgi:hypothetical protein